MTSTLRPHGSGSRRAVPSRPTREQREALTRWLEQEQWVLRPVWERWLANGGDALKVSLDRLTRNQLAAAIAWLRQQRHALHDVVAGGLAPDGWLEQRPLYQSIEQRLDASVDR